MKLLRAFSQLSLICLTAVLTAPALRAAAPPLPREVHALNLTDTAPSLFFVDAEGAPQPFQIGNIQRGPANQVPAVGSLRLFRKTPDANGAPVMTPALEIPIPEQPGPLLLAFFYDKTGRTTYRLITSSPGNHPAGTVRFVNLSSEQILCKIDDSLLELAPNEDSKSGSKLTDGQTFTYTYGARQPDGTLFKSPAKRLRLPKADMRLMIIFACRYETTVPGQAPLLVIRDARIYDTPPAQPATPALPQVSAVR